jgi:excinuclease ABC subunit B
MYADNMTGSMKFAIEETDRRREVQRAYNEKHGTLPSTVIKAVRETVRSYDHVAEIAAQYDQATLDTIGKDGSPIRIEEIPVLIAAMEKEMKDLAKAMEFEKAAGIRDEITRLREIMGVSGGKIGQEKRKLPGRRQR